MPSQKRQVKRETSLGKVTPSRRRGGRLKPTESPARGSAQDTGDVTLVPSPSGDQQRSVVHTARKRAGLRGEKVVFVPVVDRSQSPLMPTTPARARKWIESGKATPFWKRGVFCVRLNVEPSDNKTQPIAVGIDPGSKREAFTVKSEKHTYLNILSEAVTWVKDAVERRRNARKSRRRRNAPCRQNRENRGQGGISPSTKARWQWKLRIVRWLKKMFLVKIFVVEDVKAKTTGEREWDVSFSPIEIGKRWFYAELSALGELKTHSGWETKLMRDELRLKKSKNKLADKFECHNVDSWVLARSAVGGPECPGNTDLIKLVPLQFHRRQIHCFQPQSGGIRGNYGGTKSAGFTRGSIVLHTKRGLCYVGGTMDGRVSLHDPSNGKRLAQNAKPKDISFLAYSSWRREGRSG